MSQQSPTPRPRAVTLTPEALEILKQALEKSWRDSGLTTRFTRQVKAELLGVSVPTVKRILDNEGVDRTSLIQAFASLGEPWKDAYIFKSESQATTISNSKTHYFLGAAAVLGVITIGFMARANPKPDPNAKLARQVDHSQIRWIIEYDAKLEKATQLYHKAEYTLAEKTLEEAMALANGMNTPRNFEAALLLKGQIAAARGRLEPAEKWFVEALKFRDLRKVPDWGPLNESIATSQIRLKKFLPSKQQLDRAERAFKLSKEPNGIASVLCNRGVLAAAQSRTDEALGWFAKALEVPGMSDPGTVINVRGERAMVYLLLGRINEADQELEACLAFWTKQAQPRWIALIEMRLALVEAKQTKPQQARTRLARALAGFQKVGDEARIAEVEGHIKALESR